MTHRNLAWLLIVPGLIGLGVAIGYSAPAPDQDYQLVRQFVEVMAEVDANYVRELAPEDRQKFVEDAIGGGLRKLDPHSVYLNERQLKEFDTETEGSFDGVGILLGQDEKTKRLKISWPFAGGSAYESGLIANDVIVKVGDTDTRDMTAEQASKLIKGERGTKVTLTIGRGDKEFPVTLTRARIAMHPVAGVSRRADDPAKWNWFVDPQNKVALIRISSFSGLTTKEVEEAVKEIEAAGARALVLDLRDNPGGLLDEATKIADLFLTDGKIVTTKDRRGGEKTSSARGAGTVFLPAETKPMVVLVNRDSASASEIVAAALQDNNRAVVVGERTYGKGSVQSVFRLAPDQKNAVKLTTQTWWRPNGKNMDKLYAEKQKIDEWGVTPNEEMTVALTDPELLRYRVELRKLEYVAGRPDIVGPNPPPPPELPALKGQDGKPLWDEKKPFEDRQMDKALDYLRKKLSGIGAAPRRPLPGVPDLVPA
ncbi:S41 family peptidase [Gemmata sp.]|uniref:S41 family peptidase n=1 Tax=Gemmata sp. TaxID=1914242 RepID=UPI003F7203F7